MSSPGEQFAFQANQPAAEVDASTPFVAAADGEIELLQESIKQLGILPNAADPYGFTFLHSSCGYCRDKVMQWFIGLYVESNGMHVNAMAGDGDTAVHHCYD